MKLFRFVDDAAGIIARTGQTQTEIARIANIDRQHLNKKILNRSGLRENTAWRIARAFATLESISPDSAFNLLFEIVEENRNPLLAAA